ncbi:MAG: ClpXP protease specificity-enhancing factor SspB [Hyphomicrobiales bacterium]
MVEDLMRYDLLAQDALRGVVRSAVRYAGRFGLPGEHHFYITFETTHPDVRLSARLRQKYPREMTIILQHQFWNLQVGEDRFEVELSFDNISECLVVPFVAVKGFFDPCVQFGLQFGGSNTDTPDRQPTTNSDDAALPGAASTSSNALSATVRAVTNNSREKLKTQGQPPPANTSSAASSRVVRLDAFRKK